MSNNYPTIEALASIVHSYGQDLDNWDIEPEEDEETAWKGGCLMLAKSRNSGAQGDIRLQVVDGGWAYHTGDSSYDQDHRGDWGCASVPAGCSKRQSRDIARDLINEAKDGAACSA